MKGLVPKQFEALPSIILALYIRLQRKMQAQNNNFKPPSYRTNNIALYTVRLGIPICSKAKPEYDHLPKVDVADVADDRKDGFFVEFSETRIRRGDSGHFCAHLGPAITSPTMHEL